MIMKTWDIDTIGFYLALRKGNYKMCREMGGIGMRSPRLGKKVSCSLSYRGELWIFRFLCWNAHLQQARSKKGAMSFGVMGGRT